MTETFIIPAGDNGQLDQRDWDFGGIADFIDRFPILETTTRHWSQYVKPEHIAACTIFSGINACATLWDYNFSRDEIDEIIKLAISRGYVLYQGRSRSQGRMTVLTRWNNKFPDKQMSMFTIRLFDDEFKKLSEKKIPLGVSINVNVSYWADAMDNLVINKAPYPQGTGHATGCRNAIYCVDSVPQKHTEGAAPMVYSWGSQETMEELMNGHNLRPDVSVFVKNEWLKADNSEQKRLAVWLENLQKTNEALNTAIELNSWFWHNTNQADEQNKRNAFNTTGDVALKKQLEYNEGKIRIVQTCLNNLG